MSALPQMEEAQSLARELARGTLESVWPLTFTAVFLALFFAWFERILDFNVGRITWLLALGSAVHFLSGSITADERGSSEMLRVAIHLGMLLVLGAIWGMLGGLSVPLFLLFFAAPVAAAAVAFGPWLRVLAVIGTLGTILVTAALSCAPLRWYLAQVGLPMQWLEPAALLVAPYLSQVNDRIDPALAVVSLLVAATALLALELGANALSEQAAQSQSRLQQLVAGLRQREGMALDLLRSSPLPEAMVLTQSHQIVIANDRFRDMFAPGISVDGTDLFSLVGLEFPETLRNLLRLQEGRIISTFRSADGGSRTARIHVCQTSLGRSDMARISFEPCALERQLTHIVDSVDALVLALDSRELIVHTNPAARQIFIAAVAGTPAAQALQLDGLPEGWWRASAGTSVQRRLSIGHRVLNGRVISRPADRFDEAMTIIYFSGDRPA